MDNESPTDCIRIHRVCIFISLLSSSQDLKTWQFISLSHSDSYFNQTLRMRSIKIIWELEDSHTSHSVRQQVQVNTTARQLKWPLSDPLRNAKTHNSTIKLHQIPLFIASSFSYLIKPRSHLQQFGFYAIVLCARGEKATRRRKKMGNEASHAARRAIRPNE
jgi:hypothetical protein